MPVHVSARNVDSRRFHPLDERKNTTSAPFPSISTFMARRPCIRLLFTLLLSAVVATAERYRFRNYGPDDGLNTAVSVILQDHTGFLWVGTGNGLFRYDGAHFQHFGLEEGLPSASIRCLVESAD